MLKPCENCGAPTEVSSPGAPDCIPLCSPRCKMMWDLVTPGYWREATLDDADAIMEGGNGNAPLV